MKDRLKTLLRPQQTKDKVFLLPLFENNEHAKMGGFYRYNIEDPYGKSLDEFHKCFRRIAGCVKGLFDEIEKRKNSPQSHPR